MQMSDNLVVLCTCEFNRLSIRPKENLKCPAERPRVVCCLRDCFNDVCLLAELSSVTADRKFHRKTGGIQSKGSVTTTLAAIYLFNISMCWDFNLSTYEE